MITAKACAKIILFGEHAVVFGKPGIAVPVKKCYTLATISSEPFSYTTDKELNEEETIKMAKLFKLLFSKLDTNKNLSAHIESNIPVGCGMGSSASLSISLIRAFSNFLSLNYDAEKINSLAFECEKIFHGNPSGLDNTVITYEMPVFYRRKKTEFFELKKPIHLVIGNTGIKSSTKEAVEGVRKRYEKDERKYLHAFDEIEKITEDARESLEKGDIRKVGKLMSYNHKLLKELEVSSDALDGLVSKAIKAGAYGAKLAGAGLGGCMVALADERNKDKIMKSMKDSCHEVIYTVVS